MISTPYSFISTENPPETSYIETTTLYSPSFARPGPLPARYTTTATKYITPIYNISGSSPTIYDRVKDYTSKKLNTPYRLFIALCMAFVNFFFPIVDRTVCDVNFNRPSTLERAFDFALRVFYVVDKDSLGKVHANIKCIGIPTDKINYLPVFSKFFFFFLSRIILYTLIILFFFALVAVIVVIALFLSVPIAKFGKRAWIRCNRPPVFRPLDYIRIPSTNLHINEDLLYRDRCQREPLERRVLRELGANWFD